MTTHFSHFLLNGRYELEDDIGRGSSSVVYRARDREAPDRPLAIKILRPQRTTEGLARLMGEYEVAKATNHPGLVRIFNIDFVRSGPNDIESGSVFLAEELIEGRFLDLGLAQNCSPKKRIAILWKVLLDGASILDSLHRVGLLHRDVKPANLVLCKDRVRLCDLGLAAAPIEGLPGGTPGFIGPEVITGSQDTRSDLYGLAASIYWLATGRHPRSTPGADAATLLTNTLYGDLVPLRDLAAWVPAGLAQIIDQALDGDPNRRPTGASELLKWAQRKTRTRPLWALSEQDQPRRPLFPPKLIGRGDYMTRLVALIEQRNQVGPSIVLLTGTNGVGRHRLASEALIRLKVRHAAGPSASAGEKQGQKQDLRVLEGDWTYLLSKVTGRRFSPPSYESESTARSSATPQGQAAALAEALSNKDDTTRSVLLVRDAHQPHVTEAIIRLAAFADERLASTWLLAPIGEKQASRMPQKPWVVRIGLDALDESESRQLLESMVGRPLDPRFTSLLHKLADGLPARLVELIQTAWAAAQAGQSIEEMILSRGFEEKKLAKRAIDKMPETDKETLAALAVLGARPGVGVSLERLRGVVSNRRVESCLTRLHSTGMVDWTPQGPTATQPAIADMALKTLERSRKTELQRRALSLLDDLLKGNKSDLVDPPPMLWASLGRLARRRRRRALGFSALSKAADAFCERGESVQATMVAQEAVALNKTDENTVRWAARHAARSGRYDQALQLLENWSPAENQGTSRESARTTASRLRMSPRGLVEKAEYLRKGGRLDEAVELFQNILANEKLDRPLLEEARAGLSRTFLAMGQTQQAIALVENSPFAEGDDTGLTWLETKAIVLFYAGRSSQAMATLTQAEGIARAEKSPERLSRILGLSGMVQQEKGRLILAESSYEEALELARSSGDIHSTAVYEANLGAVLLDKGRPDSAIELLASAARTLRILGIEDHFASALYNLGTAWLRLGEPRAAVREVSAGLQAVTTPLASAYLKMLQSEVLQRLRSEEDDSRGNDEPNQRRDWPDNPIAAALEAVELLCDLHVPTKEPYAWANLVLVAAASNEIPPRRDEAVEALRSAFATPDPMVRATAAQALFALLNREIRASGSQCRPAAEKLFDSTWDEVLGTCLQTVGDLDRFGSRELAWRLSLRAGLCADPPHRSLLLGSAKRIFDDLLEQTDITYKAGRQSDPEAVMLSAVSAAAIHDIPSAQPANARAVGPSGTKDTLALRRLLDVTRRLAEERHLDTLLTFILDAVIDLTGAERGFLLLAGDQGLEVRAQRHMDAEATDSKTRWSHSIARRAMEQAAPVLTLDALDDSRFAEAGSVMNLKLRSVLAVPLIARSTPVGTLYMDNRMRRGAFTERDAELALSFADQAAAAIQTARLLELAEQRRREIEKLNEHLARRLERAESHIQTLRTEVASARSSLVEEDRYGQLVGHSRAMQDVFELIERVSATDLPVVILGESGTGKELVAKAIHNRSLRSQGPFASENCGAVTESLLESLLFGHEKGAFTGASRRQKGLFEIAHQGTLFLDEVGEMSPAMQVKLLRVLQDGTFRRVGGDRLISVDVRVVAASNKDIESMVETGTFRRDLFYRLAVVLIRVPPLRHRPEDIPLLVDHFIQRYADTSRNMSIEPQAMKALMSHPWPGNVRQLENEIMRIVALSRGPITLADLSPTISAGHHETMPETLDLRANVAALEKRLITKALRQTSGNKSRAAAVLGLSRYGLLKKIHRHGIDAAADPSKRNES